MPRKPPSHVHTHAHTLDNIYLQELIAVGNDSYHTMHCLVYIYIYIYMHIVAMLQVEG